MHITQTLLKRFEAAIAVHDARTVSSDIELRLQQAMRAALVSEADVLRAELRHYENPVAGVAMCPPAQSGASGTV